MLHSPENWGFNGADIMSVFERQQGMLKFLNQSNSVELGSDQYLGLVSSSFPVAPPADHGGSWSPPTLKEEGDTVLMERKNSNKRKSEFVAEEKSKEKRSKPAKSSPENSSNSTSNQKSKPSEVQKPDYIHVRARRGQATDSHSLAERARREKIGKKMKCLQELVPGCHKVTGKAGMLDEIINYVQSLQRQVEFLSMKLTAVNPSLEGKPDNFPPNLANFPAMANLASLQQLLTQQGAINCMMDFPLFPSQVTPEGNAGSSVSIPSCISELQPFSTWNLDLQGVYSENNLGFQ